MPDLDHDYVPTMVGLCSRCRYPAVAHAPQYRLAMANVPERPEPPNAQDACHYNHSMISVQLVVDGDGVVWTRCPGCSVILEPAMAKHTYSGRETGLGRGEADRWFLRRVESYVGWFRHLFGDAP